MKRKILPKRLAGILLAAIMVVAMATPAMAVGSNSITIHKYATTDGTWAGLDEATGTTADAANLPSGATPLDGVQFTVTLMELTAGGDPSDTADYTETTTTYTGVTGSAGTSGELVFSGLDDGLYKVVETVPAGVTAQVDTFYVMLPMTDPSDGETQITDVHVYTKNVVSAEDIDLNKEVRLDDGTWGEEKNIETGETVTWRISSGIPANIANAQSYVITDTVDTAHLSIPSSVTKVYYLDGSGTEQVLDSSDYTFAPTSTGFTVTLTAAGMTKLGAAINDTTPAEDTLYIEFDTQVTAATAADLVAIPNEAALDYTNQFGEASHFEDDALVYTGGLIVTKVDGADDSALQYVEFELYKLDGTTKMYYAGIDANTGAVKWDADITKGTTLITDENGKFSVYGLEDGTYYLTEMKTKSGYNLLTSDAEITLTSTPTPVDGSGDHAYTYVAAELTVENFKGFTLPLTGGMGTLWVTVIGLALIGTSVVIVAQRKRKDAQNSSNI